MIIKVKHVYIQKKNEGQKLKQPCVDHNQLDDFLPFKMKYKNIQAKLLPVSNDRKQDFAHVDHN